MVLFAIVIRCLEKNWENRPFIFEILEHPFFTELTGSTGTDHHVIRQPQPLLFAFVLIVFGLFQYTTELKFLINRVTKAPKVKPYEEVAIVKGCMKKFNETPEKMYVEDLAALEKLTEDTILEELKNRFEKGYTYTFVGDVLLSLNSNDMPKEFPRSVNYSFSEFLNLKINYFIFLSQFHNKYVCKSRSENAPHIFSVADSAYQDMLHHEESQQIIVAGESYSGKTTNIKHAVRHLCILGEGNKGVKERVSESMEVIHMIVNSGTPLNSNSTRCVLQTQLTFGGSGKLSGALFWVLLLEKLRVSSTDM